MVSTNLLRLFTIGATAATLLAGGVGISVALEGVECIEGQVCVSTGTGIPLRILTKPGAKVFLAPDETSTIVDSDIGAFQTFYVRGMQDVVFDRDTMESTGWYQVAVADGKEPIGYIMAAEAVPWRQALAVAYTNPGTSERKPVLMFEDRASLETVLAEIEGGATTGVDIHTDVDNGSPHVGLISREPNVWTDIGETFYLLPILEHEDVSFYVSPDEMRALQISALTAEPETAAAKACDIATDDFGECQSASAKTLVVDSLSMDIVFVVDMTGSMSPFIEAVRSSISAVARKLSEESSGGAIRFGLIGYRDNMQVNPGIGFDVRNFTPELLPAEDFREALNDPAIAAEGGGDIPEEVFAGIKAGIESNWAPPGEAARIVILIGDASAHGNTSPSSVTGMDEKVLRDLADAEDIYIAAIYVGNDAGDRELARPQYEGLAAGEDDHKAVRFMGNQSDSLEASLQEVLNRVVDFVGTGNFDTILSQDDGDAPAGEGDAGATEAILGAMRAAFVDYIGTGAAAPPSITAWVVDRDLADYARRSFDVRILVSKEDIQNLIEFYNGLLAQFEGGSASTSTFFGGVRSGSTLASYDLGLEKDQELQESGVMPQVIAGLPYKSEILTLTLDEFKNASADQRTKFEEDLKEKIKYFEEALNNTDAWILLNDDAPDDDRMFLMDLRWLP